MTQQRDNDRKTGSERITYVNYRDDEVPREPAPNGQRGEIFRRAYDPNAVDRPREREKRIKFEVVDDSAAGVKKRSGFNPYDSSSAPKKQLPRR